MGKVTPVSSQVIAADVQQKEMARPFPRTEPRSL